MINMDGQPQSSIIRKIGALQFEVGTIFWGCGMNTGTGSAVWWWTMKSGREILSDFLSLELTDIFWHFMSLESTWSWSQAVVFGVSCCRFVDAVLFVITLVAMLIVWLKLNPLFVVVKAASKDKLTFSKEVLKPESWYIPVCSMAFKNWQNIPLNWVWNTNRTLRTSSWTWRISLHHKH